MGLYIENSKKVQKQLRFISVSLSWTIRNLLPLEMTPPLSLSPSQSFSQYYSFFHTLERKMHLTWKGDAPLAGWLASWMPFSSSEPKQIALGNVETFATFSHSGKNEANWPFCWCPLVAAAAVVVVVTVDAVVVVAIIIMMMIISQRTELADPSGKQNICSSSSNCKNIFGP